MWKSYTQGSGTEHCRICIDSLMKCVVGNWAQSAALPVYLNALTAQLSPLCFSQESSFWVPTIFKVVFCMQGEARLTLPL